MGMGEMASFSKTEPKEKLFIKGVVEEENGKDIQVGYGIEGYFVPANKGYFIQQKRGKGVDAKILIDKFGNGIVKSLLVEGKEVDFKNVKEEL